MLDRLISGAGALTDAADRLVRVFERGSGGGVLGHRPGSVVVAGICAVLAVILVIAGIESTDNPTALTMTPVQVADATDLGSRTYATISGSLASTYVETYTDENGNGSQDPGEDGVSWFYYLVDPQTRSGVTVRSETPPAELFVFETGGAIRTDPEYVALDIPEFLEESASQHFTLDATRYVDGTTPVAATVPLVDLANGIPSSTSPSRFSESRAVTYLPFCSADANGDGECGDDEVDLWDVAIFDPTSGIGITVMVDEDPEFTKASFTGMLRRDERAVSDAKTTEDLDLSHTRLDITDTYLLDAGSAPASAPLAFGLAAALGLLAGIILIGLAGGYLVYRKTTGSLPQPATTLGVGERIPLRVTGVLRTATGLVHVRETPADLLRFQTSPAASRPEPAPTGDASTGDPPVDVVTSTLILERQGRPEGVAVGLGELTRLSRGVVMPFRGRRAAARATAGTGPLLLSFGSAGDRDRAVAEMLDETGLTPGENGIARA